MAHKVFLFQSGTRLEQRSLHAGWPLSAQVVTNEEKRGLYEGFLSSRRRRRSGFLDGSSRLANRGMGFVVEILDSCIVKREL